MVNENSSFGFDKVHKTDVFPLLDSEGKPVLRNGQEVYLTQEELDVHNANLKQQENMSFAEKLQTSINALYEKLPNNVIEIDVKEAFVVPRDTEARFTVTRYVSRLEDTINVFLSPVLIDRFLEQGDQLVAGEKYTPVVIDVKNFSIAAVRDRVFATLQEQNMIFAGLEGLAVIDLNFKLPKSDSLLIFPSPQIGIEKNEAFDGIWSRYLSVLYFKNSEKDITLGLIDHKEYKNSFDKNDTDFLDRETSAYMWDKDIKIICFYKM